MIYKEVELGHHPCVYKFTNIQLRCMGLGLAGLFTGSLTACSPPINLTPTPIIGVEHSPIVRIEATPTPVFAPPTFLPYPFDLPATTPPNEAYPYILATPNATQAVIISNKATLAAEYEKTLTALPTAQPPPTFPVGQPACGSSDLASDLFRGGVTGSVVFVMSVINVSQQTCVLQGPPQIELLNAAKHSLEVSYIVWDEWADTAQNGPNHEIGIAPNETLIVRMMWDGWQAYAGKMVFVRLNLLDNLGYLENSAEIFSCQGCTYPETNSQLFVSPYDRSP